MGHVTATTTPHDTHDRQLATPKPTDVPCPDCAADIGDPCGRQWASRWFTTTPHEARHYFADRLTCCPACGNPDTTARSIWSTTGSEGIIDNCPNCGWESDPA